MELLDGIGVDGRELPGVVNALQACYGTSQAFERDAIEKILGPIDAIRHRSPRRWRRPCGRD